MDLLSFTELFRIGSAATDVGLHEWLGAFWRASGLTMLTLLLDRATRRTLARVALSLPLRRRARRPSVRSPRRLRPQPQPCSVPALRAPLHAAGSPTLHPPAHAHSASTRALLSRLPSTLDRAPRSRPCRSAAGPSRRRLRRQQTPRSPMRRTSHGHPPHRRRQRPLPPSAAATRDGAAHAA